MTEMAMKLPLKIATEPNDLVHRCKLFELVFKVETREVVLKSTLAPSCYRKKKKKNSVSRRPPARGVGMSTTTTLPASRTTLSVLGLLPRTVLA